MCFHFPLCAFNFLHNAAKNVSPVCGGGWMVNDLDRLCTMCRQFANGMQTVCGWCVDVFVFCFDKHAPPISHMLITCCSYWKIPSNHLMQIQPQFQPQFQKYLITINFENKLAKTDQYIYCIITKWTFQNQQYTLIILFLMYFSKRSLFI